jgi:hypothetical protein
VGSLRSYLVTPPMSSVFSRIVDGLWSTSGSRAWRITGDYGTGKSSFALVLAHLLRDPSEPAIHRIRKTLGKDVDRALKACRDWTTLPVLVTGAREPIVPAVAKAIRRTIERLYGRRGPRRALLELVQLADEVAGSGDAATLLELLDQLGRKAMPSGRSGVLLVLDELGKFLEHAAMDPEKEDVFVLQRLAEVAARSGDRPLIVVGLLHQGFHAYAERLPSAVRLEWEKVAGRFEEVAVDQPLIHAAALVANALEVDLQRMPQSVTVASESLRTAVLPTGWYGKSGEGLMPVTLYPLHPTVIPVLVRFFARFGQHERSLFSFLLSAEPNALQAFADGFANAGTWYRLPHFYDYVRAVFGHRLAGSSHLSNWLRITGTLDRATGSDLKAVELDVLKAVAVLNVLDTEQLLATDTVLSIALEDDVRSVGVRKAVASLKRRGILFDRGAAGGYCLWPSTSINLQNAFDRAQRTLGPVDRVTALLGPYLDASPLVARRHYIATGTLRHFEVRYTESSGLVEAVAEPTQADGLVVIALCATRRDCEAAARCATSPEVMNRPDVVVGASPPLHDVAAELQDARCWEWVAENTPELAHDSYAATEVARKVAETKRALGARLMRYFGTVGGSGGAVSWWRKGQVLRLPARGRLSAVLSDACDELFIDAPIIRNELLNRRSLSSAAAAARLRLIERIFLSPDVPELGMDTHKAPPERSMYLSVLAAGQVHREEAGRFILAEPPETADPLSLRPALTKVTAILESAGDHRVPVSDLLAALSSRPYGIRGGVAPLLLAVVVVAHAHEIAVYENGSFLPRFAAPDFLRLTKQPTSFEFQLCRISGVRREVFAQLAQIFGTDRQSAKAPELLDVVRPLSVFAAGLSEFTRRTTEVGESARLVRDALIAARDPTLLLFRDLPTACGMAPFAEQGAPDIAQARQYASRLHAAVDELRAAYPMLLEQVRDRIISGFTSPAGRSPSRLEIVQRARQVGLVVREPRLQAFARSLADKTLSDDAWAERIGSFVISRPPGQWTMADKATALDTIDVLCAALCRVEITAFWNGGSVPDAGAVRVALTSADGSESWRVVTSRPEDEESIGEMVRRLEHAIEAPASLNSAPLTELRLAAIARFLRNWMPAERVRAE